eukprot:3820944-Amphidinium_carterae.1
MCGMTSFSAASLVPELASQTQAKLVKVHNQEQSSKLPYGFRTEQRHCRLNARKKLSFYLQSKLHKSLRK